MTQRSLTNALVVLVFALVPSVAHAGPPLICHPFQTAQSELLPWGPGPSWNSPAPNYDVDRLVNDMLRLLHPAAPVLARMENMRRATIYAGRDRQVATALLQAIVDRADRGAGPERSAALFDAGYLLESYKQAAHLHRWPTPLHDGYALVVRALALSGGQPEMEFAASLMTEGSRAQAHLRCARAAASAQPLLAHNIDQVWR
jgi:hypothetical protein